MALGSSGQISIGDINEEKGLSREAVNFIVTTIPIQLYLPHQALLLHHL